MGKQPKTLITDGLPSYSMACEQVFDGTQHIRKITLKGKVHNNNKMERMNGEVRDREKIMRGLKRNAHQYSQDTRFTTTTSDHTKA